MLDLVLFGEMTRKFGCRSYERMDLHTDSQIMFRLATRCKYVST